MLKYLAHKPSVPVRKLSHRLLLHLRKTQSNHGVDWESLCIAHPASPQFVFELLDDTVRLRLLAKSQRDQSVWFWNGNEWVANDAKKRPHDKPEILDQAFEAAKTFQPMNREQVAQLLAKTKEVAITGKYELFKTSSHFDSTAKHPDWLGGDAPDVQKLTPPAA